MVRRLHAPVPVADRSTDTVRLRTKAGIRSSIFEAEFKNQHRPREWSMLIHWSLSFLQELLPPDLWARIQEAQVDPSLPVMEDRIPMINGLNGEVIKYIDTPKSIRVSRRKMRAFCSQGLDIQVRLKIPISLYSSRQLCSWSVIETFDSMRKLSSTSPMAPMDPTSQRPSKTALLSREV